MKLFIPLICYNHTCHTSYMMSIMDLFLDLQRKGIPFIAVPITFDSLVCRARNAAVAMFLSDPDATHLLFIDSDIEFSKDSVYQLIASKLPVVGAAYPQKWISFDNIESARRAGISNPSVLSSVVSVHLAKKDTRDLSGPSQLAEAEYITTGFLLIERGVFTTLIGAHPKKKYTNDIDGYMGGGDNFYDFFSVSIHPKTKRLESEDYSFSRLWRGTGGKIHILTDITLKHHGWYAYQANLFQQMCAMQKIQESASSPNQTQPQPQTLK
jgi:hypothetical protein